MRLKNDNLNSIVVPDEWSTFDEELDANITESAQTALNEVKKVSKDIPAIKTALAKFVSDWKKLLSNHPALAETLAADRIEQYFNDLSRSCGSDVDPEATWHEINMGMHGLTRVDHTSFIKLVSEESGESTEDVEVVLEAFIDEIKSLLMTCGRAKVHGFGSFFQSERAVHSAKRATEKRHCVDFRCSVNAKKALSSSAEYRSAGLGVSDTGRAVAKRLNRELNETGPILECLFTTLVNTLCNVDDNRAVRISALGTFSLRKLKPAFIENAAGVREQLPASFSIAFLADPSLLKN